MDVRVIEEEGRRRVEVQIRCAARDERIERLARRIRLLEERVRGYPLDGRPEQRRIALGDILLFEVDAGRVVIRMRDGGALESPLRLFQIEEALAGTEFARISRQALVNFGAIEAIRPELNGRLVLRLAGGRLALVTRHYVAGIRDKLGMDRA